MKIKRIVLLLGIFCCSVVLISCTKANLTKNKEKDKITEKISEALTNVQTGVTGKQMQLSTNEENANNPIDSYFQPLLKSDMPEASRRGLEVLYGKAWKEEYNNVVEWLLGKCKYEEDKENINKLNESVEEYIKITTIVVRAEMLDGYDADPNGGNDKRIEGNGTNSSLIYFQGKMYRDISMLLIQSYVSNKEQYQFLRDDYSEFSAE